MRLKYLQVGGAEGSAMVVKGESWVGFERRGRKLNLFFRDARQHDEIHV